MLGLLLVVFLLRVPLLRAVGSFLVIQDSRQPADLIYLLGGDPHTRPKLAADLYHQGLASRVVASRVEDSLLTLSGRMPNETDAVVVYLQDLGVPDSAVVVLHQDGGVTSTDDEAEVVRDYMLGQGARSVLLVTSDYHTRRARWLFRRVLDPAGIEVRVAGAEPQEIDSDAWWRSEKGLILYFEEYVKFVHNWVYR